MSQQGLVNPAQQQGVTVPSQKPKSDVYTMLLLLSLIAIGIAILCLCLEMAAYDWDVKGEGARVRSQPAASAMPGIDGYQSITPVVRTA